MASIKTFDMSPGEEMDFDVSFRNFLRAKKDVPANVDPFTVVAPEGITVISTSLVEASFVKIWVREPLRSADYKFKVTLRTQGGRKRDAEITIRVRD